MSAKVDLLFDRITDPDYDYDYFVSKFGTHLPDFTVMGASVGDL